MTDEAAWIEAGLLDPADPAVDDRREMLGYLAGLGISIEAMLEAEARRGVGVAASDQLFEAGEGRTLRSVAAEAGAPVEVARSARSSLELLLGLPEAMTPLFRRHVAGAIERSRAARGAGQVDTFLLAVGFADLVGSTALAASIGPASVGRAPAELEREAADRATAHGARLVKAIGDEVMVVGVDPVAVVTALVELRGFVEDHPVLTALRSAVAAGPVAARGGDDFGPPINLAARLVPEAAAGEVLVDAGAAAALDAAGWSTAVLGDRVLRGFEEPVTVVQVGRGPGGGR